MLTEKYLARLCKSYYDFKAALFRVIDSMCKPEGLTSMQTLMLFLLKSEARTTVGDLGAHFNITQSNASAMCKKLEKDGLIKRTRSKADERTVLLTLTEEGEASIERMLERGKRFAEELSELPQEQLDVTVATLDEATELLNKLNML